MSTKPGVFALSKQATDFVFGNVPLFFNHIKFVFPLTIFCAVLKQAGLIAQASWVALVVSAATLFLYGCFALAWHRSSLQGPDKAHERNPLNLAGDDWKFIALFFGVTGGFGLVMNGLSYTVEKVLPQYGEAIAAVGAVIALIFMFFIVQAFIRASFLFPARSVGVALSWNDAKRAAKGMMWPLIGTNIIFGLLLGVTMSVYLFVVGFIVGIGTSGAEMQRIEAIGMGIVLAIPVILGTFFVIALCVSALSRAYQWGIQNNNG